MADREERPAVAAAGDVVVVVVVALEVCRERFAVTAAPRVVDRAMLIPTVCFGAVKRVVATTELRCKKAFVEFGDAARATSRSLDVGLARTNSLVSMLDDFDFATAAMEPPLCDQQS
jgi:hypothetical protein